MRTIVLAVCFVIVSFVFIPLVFSEDHESKWETYAGVGYHHSHMTLASNPVAYEVGARYREGKGSLGLAVLYMRQRVYAEDYKDHTDVDLLRYMALFGYNVFNDVWFDVGPTVTFFGVVDDAKNDFGDGLTMPAQPGAVVGFSYRKHIVDSWNIDLAARSTFGNWEIRGPYGQRSNHLNGWEVLLDIRYAF